MANEGDAIGGGRVSRSLMPAHLARRAAVRWAYSQLTWGETRARKRGEFVMKTARDVAETMGDMKGAIMKFGQILSMMTGVLPDEMTAELTWSVDERVSIVRVVPAGTWALQLRLPQAPLAPASLVEET